MSDHSNNKSAISLGEKPSDFLQNVFWTASVLPPILVVMKRRGLLQLLRDAGDAGVPSDALPASSDMDRSQLLRILRVLQANKVIRVNQEGHWCSTARSNELTTPQFMDSFEFCYSITRRAFDGFPEYFDRLADNDDPSSIPNPFQIGMQTNLDIFPYMAANPVQASQFNSLMQARRIGTAMWFEAGFYPVADRLVKGFDPGTSQVLLVDVGGGRGHDLTAFASQYPDHPGKLVLQDQPSVIADISASTSVFEGQAHDFFTFQPITAARAYFLHSILHDWSDVDCVRILENLKPALKAGYSKVLVHEIVLSEQNPTIAATSMDMMMFAHLTGAAERTESAWRKLIESAGYKVVNIFNSDSAAESIIEAETV